MEKVEVTFITGNADKAKYLEKCLDLEIAHQRVELDEIQSISLEEIVEHKVRQAYDIVKSPVLVEDVSLGFHALSGLPGPFVKFFVDYAGMEAMCRMLDGFEDRSALAECMFGFYDGKEVVTFLTEVSGTIAAQPKGKNGYGWDTIFIQEGYTITRAELSNDEYQKAYQRSKPFRAVADFLKEKYVRLP